MDSDDSIKLSPAQSAENLEEEVDEIVNDVVKDKGKNFFNFLLNASNQANLANTYDTTYTQLNALFVLISPYQLENFNIEGLNLDINMSDDGSLYIKGQEFEAIEIEPGIRILGISKK